MLHTLFWDPFKVFRCRSCSLHRVVSIHSRLFFEEVKSAFGVRFRKGLYSRAKLFAVSSCGEQLFSFVWECFFTFNRIAHSTRKQMC